MGRVTRSNGAEWSAPDPEVAELFAVARQASRSSGARAVLSESEPALAVHLDEDPTSRSVAVALRVAVGLICARLLDGDPSPAARGQRDRLYELDQLLQPLIAPRRGKYATFPSRRHHRQLTTRGIDPTAVACLIGLPLSEAQIAANKLGLRVSTAHMLLNRADRQLDVLADEGAVTNILGLHID
jgi:hypothetical protein